MEFYPFDLFVKDLATRRILARYDSLGLLYTLHLPTSTTPTLCDVPYALAATTSFATWHHHLGHPGPNVLSKLSSSLAITCPRSRDDSLCHACQLGWHIQLPFPNSSSRVIQPFALVHYDFWTSLVLSVSGYKYYLVILNDCTHYSWTILLCQKSAPSPSSPTSSPLCPRSLDAPSRASSVIMNTSLITAPPALSSSQGVQLQMSCPYTSLQNSKAEHMIHTTNVSCTPCCSRLPFHPIYEMRAFMLLPTSSTSYPQRQYQPPPLTLLFSAPLPPKPTSGVFGCAYYSNTSITAPHKLPHVPVSMSFLGTLLSIRGAHVSI
jgi:hypothetical protein